jgi:hypothetical protein
VAYQFNSLLLTKKGVGGVKIVSHVNAACVVVAANLSREGVGRLICDDKHVVLVVIFFFREFDDSSEQGQISFAESLLNFRFFIVVS